MTKRIIVLGGGYGGVLTAKKLAKKIKKQKMQKDFTVTLIDKNPFHTMLTELHEVAAGRVDEQSIKMDFEKIFAGRNVEFVMDSIAKIDFEGGRLIGERQNYDYDYLVVGTGSKPAFFGVEGAKENAYSLWSFDDAIKLKNHLLDNFRAAERTCDKKKRGELLTFFVVGAGFTGVEMMGELAEWIPILCHEYNIPREEVRLVVCDMVDRVITSIPEKLANKAAKRLRKMGVEILLKAKVSAVTENNIDIVVNGKNTTYVTNTVIWTAGIEGSEVVQEAFGFEKTKGARVETDQYLRSKQYENVYIVGDNIFYVPEGETSPVPQMVENCEASSHTAAANLLADATGKGEKHPYKPKFHGMMVCIGGRYGTAYVGTHKKKFGLPSFFAMLSKHFINIVYFIQVLGWHKIYSYIVHEFFQVRHNRSFVGGHFSNSSPNFWAVPLRLFVGFSWLISGLEKLPKILYDFNTLFLLSFPEEAADVLSGATAVSSATAAVTESAAEAAFALPLPQFLNNIIDGAIKYFIAPIGNALPVPGFLKGIVDWTMVTFVKDIAPYFQAAIVLAEIAIGILLIIGLFTTLSAVASSVLCVMIYMSGWSDVSIIWFFVGGIALIGIGGTGQVFAADYYIIPWLKEKWKKFGFVKKWYIYNE